MTATVTNDSDEAQDSNDAVGAVPQSPTVPDDEIIAAIGRAEARAVNGLPDPVTIAAECPLKPKTVSNRLRELEAEGRVVRHRSVAPSGGTVQTVDLPDTTEADR